MILVTGGTGLVGAHLLLHLADSGKAVRALYRTSGTIARTKSLFEHNRKANLFENIEWVQGDVNDVPTLEDAFIGVDYVYHCAAFISFDPQDEEKLRKVNIEGTANMVNCALAFGVKKFCHVSSIATLGDPREGELNITEETEWNPEISHSDYALSKRGAETEVWRAWQEGLDVVIVNPGVIFGYGFWAQGSGSIVTSVYKGLSFYTKGICGIVAVEDVVTIMRQVMDSSTGGERYTVVAENMRYDDILESLAKGMKKKKPGIYASPSMTSFAWRMDWLLTKLFLKKRSFTRDMAKSSHAQEIMDNSKISTTLNYKFMAMGSYLEMLAKRFISGQPADQEASPL
jgi:dihydroflavonol-4-reductase